ncbi:MAG: hypothetical protein ACRD5R_06795 [Candidatus Acidiferrales bacterium]
MESFFTLLLLDSPAGGGETHTIREKRTIPMETKDNKWLSEDERPLCAKAKMGLDLHSFDETMPDDFKDTVQHSLSIVTKAAENYERCDYAWYLLNLQR